MMSRIALIGLAAALAFAPLAAAAQTPASQGASAPAIPNRASARNATHRGRTQHMNTLNRQKARATSEHARQVRAATPRQ